MFAEQKKEKMWKSPASRPMVAAENLQLFCFSSGWIISVFMTLIKGLCMLMRYDKTEEIAAGNMQVLSVTCELFCFSF